MAAVSPSFAVLLVARAVQGVGSSLFGTSINRYLLVVTDKAELGRFLVAGLPILVGGALLVRSQTLRNLDQTVRDTGVD